MLLQERLADIEKLKYSVAKIKTVIDAYLANTTEPLDERWQLYQALPSFLRNHKSWVQDFIVKTDGTFVDDSELRDCNRYEVVDVCYFLQDYADELHKHGEIDISATKEYILSKNLGSFENDW